MSPTSPTHAAHRSNRPGPSVGRFGILLLVVLVLVGVGLIDHFATVPTRGSTPPMAAAETVGTGAESSSWYCTSSTIGAKGLANGTVYATNTGSRTVVGSMTSVSDSGATQTTALTVPARTQIAAVPSAPLASGSWSAETLEFDGGGITVTQAVSGPNGWAVAPCASDSAEQWIFAAGSTSANNNTFIALYNPTPTPDVVDMTFVTPAGVVHPADFEGLEISPGQLQVEGIGTYVQDQSDVSTIVATRAGRVVAGQLQVISDHGVNGLALSQGQPGPEPRWDMPSSSDLQGGRTTFSILNPTGRTERVTAQAHLASGSPAAFVHLVAPNSTWVLDANEQTRIPLNASYALTVSAVGGPGVVVDRTVSAPAAAPAPQAGIASSLGVLTSTTVSRDWVIPAPGTKAVPATAGAAPYDLSLFNPSNGTVTFTLRSMTPQGLVTILTQRLMAQGFTSIPEPQLTAASPYPIVASANGPLALLEDLVPAGADGAVTMPGIPLK